jgi:hypothetical protein
MNLHLKNRLFAGLEGAMWKNTIFKRKYLKNAGSCHFYIFTGTTQLFC